MSKPLPTSPATQPPGPGEEADLCHTLADFHGAQGRMVIGTCLRSYLDPLVLTPTEVIHNGRLLKALLGQGQLVENAAVKVAIAQARKPGQEQRTRRQAIQAAIDETLALVRSYLR